MKLIPKIKGKLTSSTESFAPYFFASCTLSFISYQRLFYHLSSNDTNESFFAFTDLLVKAPDSGLLLDTSSGG